MDKTTFTDIKNGMLANARTFVRPVTAFMVDSNHFIQSTVFVEGIPLFMVKIYENLQFDTFHCGVKCYVSTLSKNFVTTVKSWSILEEMIRLLNSLETGNKKRSYRTADESHVS